MSKGWIADRVNFTLIIAILAIVSIMLNSTSQSYRIVEAKTNTKTSENNTKAKNVLIESPILAALTETNPMLLEESKTVGIIDSKTVTSDEKQTESILVVKKKRTIVTAYSSTIDQTDSSPFFTASGTHVHNGTIASNFLKFGTKVRFPSVFGDRIFIVEDRMNARFNDRVDIWFPNREDAKKFGVKWLEIEVLE